MNVFRLCFIILTLLAGGCQSINVFGKGDRDGLGAGGRTGSTIRF